MEAGPLEPGPDAPDSSSLIAVFIRIDVRKPRRFLPPCGGRSILFGTRLVYGACAPSPLAGGGRDGGETHAISPFPLEGEGILWSPPRKIGAEQGWGDR